MSLLTMVQKAARRIGILSPSSVVGSSDLQITQLLAIAMEEGEELRDRYSWTYRQKEATFTTVATASQGAIVTLAGADFGYVINDTIWDRTTDEPIAGPLSPQQWQALQAFPVTGPYYQYRIRGGFLLFDPVPSAGVSCAFEYMSKAYCETSTGTDLTEWAADTDVGLLDEDTMTAGIIWRWKQIKGLDYAEDFAKYERRVADLMARDGSKATLDMGAKSGARFPGIIVPQGSWDL